MIPVIGYIIFLTIFSIINFLLHFYSLGRLVSYLGVQVKYFYFILVGLTLTFPLATMLVRSWYNILSRALYTISAAWFGFIFLLFSTILVADIVLLLLKFAKLSINQRWYGIVILVLVVAVSLYAVVNAQTTRIEEVTIPVKDLPKAVDGMKIVQLTDIHIGAVNEKGFLTKVVAKTNELNPDAVMITGDLVDGSAKLSPELFAPLKELNSKAFFITGNHENYEGADSVSQMVSDSGVTVIRNDVIEFDDIQIVGVDNPPDSDRDKMIEFRKIQDKIDKSKPTIFLFHMPAGFKEAANAGVDIQLSGHTHKGQLWPFSLIVKRVFPYLYGLYDYNDSHIYVGSGVGTWGPPMRLGSHSEIVLITLRNSE